MSTTQNETPKTPLVIELPRERWNDLSTENKKSLLARYTVVLLDYAEVQ